MIKIAIIQTDTGEELSFNDLTNTGREIVRHDLKLLLEDLESFEVKE